MKTALYARVSRDDLHCENQKLVLDAWAKNNPEEECTYFQEEMTSRKTRPVKESIIMGFREGKFDTIVIVQMGRWARSLLELVQNIEEVLSKRGRFVIIKDNMDFTKKGYNAAAQLQLSIFAAFAQFEREIIRERTLDGLARAKAQGKKLGRPFGHGAPMPGLEKVSELMGKGLDERNIAKELNTSRYKVQKAMEAIKRINPHMQGGD